MYYELCIMNYDLNFANCSSRVSHALKWEQVFFMSSMPISWATMAPTSAFRSL